MAKGLICIWEDCYFNICTEWSIRADAKCWTQKWFSTRDIWYMIQYDKMRPTEQAHRHKYGGLVFAIFLIIYLFKMMIKCLSTWWDWWGWRVFNIRWKSAQSNCMLVDKWTNGSAWKQPLVMQKMALYCPQGNGTFRQQLLMMYW